MLELLCHCTQDMASQSPRMYGDKRLRVWPNPNRDHDEFQVREGQGVQGAHVAAVKEQVLTRGQRQGRGSAPRDLGLAQGSASLNM